MSARRALAPYGLAALWAALGCDPAARPATSSARCGDAASEARGHGARLPGRVYDVAVLPGGGYALALSTGVAELHPCTFERTAGCDDAGEARRLRARPGTRTVDYLAADGTAAACDLARGARVPPRDGALAALTARREERAGDVVAWVDGAAAWLRPGRAAPRRLAVSGEALGVALGPGARSVAVTDRAGAVAFFTVPGGLRYARFDAHPRNAYAVAHDAARARVVTVAGPGQLATRAWPAPP